MNANLIIYLFFEKREPILLTYLYDFKNKMWFYGKDFFASNMQKHVVFAKKKIRICKAEGSFPLPHGFVSGGF